MSSIVALCLAILTALARFLYWTGKVDGDREGFKAYMGEIRSDIKKIFQALPAPTATGANPLQLTEFGEQIAKRIGAWEWAASEARITLESDKLPQPLKRLQPFQVEAFCESYIEQNSGRDGVIRDKLNEAIYEFGLNRERALPVLRIPLRQTLLEIKSKLQG